MNNRILSSVSFLVAMTALLLSLGGAAPSPASAQVDTRCRPDDLLCADAQIGPLEGHIRIGPGDVSPPPVVTVAPPPVVVVPPVQPPIVVVQGTPPPPQALVVVQTPPPREPQVVAVQTVRQRRVVYDLVPTFDMGLHIDGGLIATDHNLAMGGMDAGIRIRPERHIGIDIGTGFWYGTDYNGRERWEMPLRADLLIFFNPEHMFQVYALVGGGMTFGQAGLRDMSWAGGEAGLGAELRLTRFFAINADVRGFIRQRVGDGPAEFSQISSTGRLQTTDTSGGVYGTIGMTFYFFGR